jgi:hypothetical protein
MSVDSDVKTFGNARSLGALTHVGFDVARVPQALRDEAFGEPEVKKLATERLDPLPGLQVLTRIGAAHLTGSPILEMEISLVELDAGSYLYSVDLVLVQGVTLRRLGDSDRAMWAPTWHAQAVGVAQKGQLSSVSDKAAAVVDAFVRDFPGE